MAHTDTASPPSLLLQAYRAALARCNGHDAVKQALHPREGDGGLRGGRYHPGEHRTIRVLGAGKAALPMALAAQERLSGWTEYKGGVVVTKDGHGAALRGSDGAPEGWPGNHPGGRPGETPGSPGIEVLEAAHPIPDERSVAAGRRLLAEAAALGPEDLLIFVLSGGASSLIEVPAPGLTLDDLRRAGDALLRSGLAIEAINQERRRLSAIKGGQLAASTRAAVLTLILSDVPGGDPTVVGSGPTLASFPPMDPRSHALVVADHRDALAAASRSLQEAGVEVVEEHPGGLSGGSARDQGAALGEIWRRRGARPVALLWSGEASVEVRGGGRGGRNQELALAAALALRGGRGVTVGVLATDGQDGPTDAAGAIVDGETAGRIAARGLDPRRHLDANDAYPALAAAGALVKTGPTGTNVNDLCITLVEPWASGAG